MADCELALLSSPWGKLNQNVGCPYRLNPKRDLMTPPAVVPGRRGSAFPPELLALLLTYPVSPDSYVNIGHITLIRRRALSIPTGVW